MRYFVFLLFSVFTFYSCSSNTEPKQEILDIDGGKISGIYHDSTEIHSFKGIPFAAPPVGDLRWKAPQPVVAWEGVRKCDSFGPSPMQGNPSPFMYWSEEFLIPKEPIGEDCLYLNVWTCSLEKEEKRPVLVYIYGGGFQSGGTGCAIYDGTNMAKKGVVFVSINYRVGVFGFLAHPELTEESANNTSGNYGMLDMVAALNWVKNNIAEFGGDPDNVTIAGQSAGSFAVNFLTVSPLAKGLFHKAIAESGAAFLAGTFGPEFTLENAEQLGLDFAQSLDATSLTDLRAKTADEIFKTQGGLRRPFTDGYVIPENVMDAYQNGNQNDVPVIIGWNKDDKVSGPPVSAEKFTQQMKERFGAMADDFFAVYPASSEEEAQQSQFDMSRDQTFGLQMYNWGTVQSGGDNSAVYMYNFNRALPSHTPETAFGAFHSGEIVYAYDNLHTLDRPWEPVDQEIADIMSGYWANFAKNGNPNGPGLPQWDPYNIQEKQVMIIDTKTGEEPLPDADKFSFWDKVTSMPQ